MIDESEDIRDSWMDTPQTDDRKGKGESPPQYDNNTGASDALPAIEDSREKN